MRNNTILLIEDNLDDELLTLRAFSKIGLKNRIMVVRDGVEATDYLFGTGLYDSRDVTDKPQLILLDLKLPKIDGLDVLRRIRNDERTSQIPVVILTTSNEPSDIRECYNLRANSYVCKPVDFNQFIEVMQQIAHYWLVHNQLPPKEI